MSETALYFPYIDFPSSRQATAVLLYWDEVEVMAPTTAPLGPWTQELERVGLVRPVAPQRGLLRGPQFKLGYSELLQAQDDVGWPPSAPMRLHRHKGPFEVWYELDQRGLTSGDGAAGWTYVDGTAARLYLAYLAQVMAVEKRAVTITDDPAYDVLMGIWPDGRRDLDWDLARSGVLGEVLPAPTRLAEPRDIAAFKAAHGDELRRLRLRVESEVQRCARELVPSVRGRMVDHARSALESETAELRERMQHRWSLTLDSSVSAVLMGVPAAVAGLSTGRPLVTATAGIPLAVELVRRMLGASYDEGDAAAYAVLAQREFG